MSFTKFLQYSSSLRKNLVYHSHCKALIRPVVLQASIGIPLLTSLNRVCNLTGERMLRFQMFRVKFEVLHTFIVFFCAF